MDQRTSCRAGGRFLGLLLLALIAGRAHAATVYVDARAVGTGNGTSWTNAFVLLEDALLVPGPVEIWVAAGTYAPAPPGGNRNLSFWFGSGQALYGGFRGTETARSQRDAQANPTILTGDLNGDDLPGFEGSVENSYHVLRCADADSTAVLDGFMVRGGSAREASGFNSAGGGVLIENASPGFAGCRFETCFARSGGVAVVLGGTPSFSGCAFRGNMVQNGRGGALTIGGGGSLVLTDCVFEDNLVRGGVGSIDGGALFIDLGAGASITGCTFHGNSSTSSSNSIVATGGAITSLGTGVKISRSTFRANLANVGGGIWTARDLSIINCLFDGNEAVVGDGAVNGGGVGGALVGYQATVSVVCCTGVANEADDGGGLYTGQGATIQVENSILWGNQDATGFTGQAQIKGPGTKSIRFSCVQDISSIGTYLGSTSADPRFVDADGPDNAPGTADDNFRLLPGSPCIDAADNAVIPAGVAFDIDGGPRRRDDPVTADTGSGSAPIVDMGAHEYSGASATGTVMIASDAAFTATMAVVLTLSASAPAISRMAFSNDGVSWTGWETFGAMKNWTLAAGDGIKTAHARFGNAAGSILAEARDTIVLDTTAPAGSIDIDGGAPSTITADVTLFLAASDGGSGVAEMRFSDDGETWTPWEPFAEVRAWTLPGGNGLKTVHAQYRDLLGNASPTASDTILLQIPAVGNFIRGDADGDPALPPGFPDVLDALVIRTYLENLPVKLVRNFDAADVNDDGIITYEDIEALGRYLAGAVPELPAPFPVTGPDPTADGISVDAVAPASFVGRDERSRLQLYRVPGPGSPEELRMRLALVHGDGGGPASAAHAAVRYDPDALALVGALSLSGGGWSWIMADFDDGTAPVGETGVTLFCESCPGSIPTVPEGDILEFTFQVLGPSTRPKPVELIDRVGRGDLYYYTGFGARSPSGLPVFVPCGYETVTPFARGDANDDGGFDISDAVRSLLVLFAGYPADCQDALDADDSGILDISDPIYSLQYLFHGGQTIPAPFPDCGVDQGPDGLGCASYEGCP